MKMQCSLDISWTGIVVADGVAACAACGARFNPSALNAAVDCGCGSGFGAIIRVSVSRYHEARPPGLRRLKPTTNNIECIQVYFTMEGSDANKAP